jgi:signal transduction histidine kinase
MPSEARAPAPLPPLSTEAAAALLAPPWLPSEGAAAVPLARRAGAGAIPVLVRAPAAGGRLRLVRALHALAGCNGPLLAATGRRPGLAHAPAGAALYLDLGALAPDGVLALEALLDDARVWVLGGAEPGVRLPAALATRFSTVGIEVPPLAARTADLPALAAALLEDLARRLGTAAPHLTTDALELLVAHAWPGDVAELQAVLARALLVAEGSPIQAGHLTLSAAEPRLPTPAAPVPALAPGSAELEYLLAELAHELRNPLVTIKTFADHLPQLLEDAELRGRFATLTADAIERMDGLLENVLAFARLGPPRREAIQVGPIMERALADLEPELAGRSVRVRQAAAPDARCAADPAHLAYALRNLFAGVVREVPAREQLLLDATANGVVTLRFAAGAEAAARLRRLAAPGESGSLADPTLLPLAFRLARAVLERNGGTLAVVAEAGEATSVVIRLPTAPAEDARA